MNTSLKRILKTTLALEFFLQSSVLFVKECISIEDMTNKQVTDHFEELYVVKETLTK